MTDLKRKISIRNNWTGILNDALKKSQLLIFSSSFKN